MPLTVLAKDEETIFSPEVKAAITASTYDSAYKSCLGESHDSGRRDFKHFTAALSYLKQDVNVVWYPSWGLHSARGVIVGRLTARKKRYAVLADCPKHAGQARCIAPGGRATATRVFGGQTGAARSYIKLGPKIQYNLGSWISDSTRKDDPVYELLLKPDGPRLFLRGGPIRPHLVGWQEGAALSAIRANQT